MAPTSHIGSFSGEEENRLPLLGVEYDCLLLPARVEHGGEKGFDDDDGRTRPPPPPPSTLPWLPARCSEFLIASAFSCCIFSACIDMRALAPPKLILLTRSLWLSLELRIMSREAGRLRLSSLLDSQLSLGEELPDDEEPLPLPE